MADQENKKYEEGLVHKTTDYGQFKYIDSNRTISKNHVQHLVQSFEANPELVQTRPILVNEDMQVIDGQHRLQACATLRVPVYFMVASGTNVESAQLMNALQKGWSLIDFARSYALNRKDPERAATYKSFLSLFEEFKVPISVLVTFCEQRTRHNATASFKKGELTIKNLEVTRVWLEQLEEVEELVSPDVLKHNRYAFVSSLLVLFKHEAYDQDRMIKQLKNSRLTMQVDRLSYLRALETIYNFNMKTDESRVRFF